MLQSEIFAVANRLRIANNCILRAEPGAKVSYVIKRDDILIRVEGFTKEFGEELAKRANFFGINQDKAEDDIQIKFHSHEDDYSLFKVSPYA